MAFIIKSPSEFTMEIEQWTRETDADGAEMAKVIEKLLNNDVYLKSETERQEHTVLVTLTASGWAGASVPFTQTVAVSGAREGGEALLVSALEPGSSEAVQKAYTKAYGIISSGIGRLGDGTAIFQVYKKPETSITVGLRGVM